MRHFQFDDFCIQSSAVMATVAAVHMFVLKLVMHGIYCFGKITFVNTVLMLMATMWLQYRTLFANVFKLEMALRRRTLPYILLW
jgi:hypothetical protein